MKQILSFCLFISTLYTLSAQESAEKYYSNKNYKKAIEGYAKQLAVNGTDYNLNLMLGKCYLESNIDKWKAIAPLERIKDSPENNFEAMFLLGRAYHQNYKFDEAIATFKMFQDSLQDSLANATSNKYIQYCKNAKQLVANPLNVQLRNLGDTVNSEAPDYNVFVEQNEEILVFSSNRDKRNKAEETTPNGWKTADVFVSYHEEGVWQKPRVQSSVCTPVNEEPVGMSSDGKLLFLNINGRGVKGEMVVSNRKGKSFKTPVKVEKTVNSSATEMTSSVSNDKQVFYYASDRKGGKGGFDIYQAKRLPDNTWAQSKNLAAILNTEYDELFPQLSPDEKTLYFVSEGHNSMGGFDIFKSQWDEKNQTWGKPQNMGYPINTPLDDMHFAINGDGSMGYISTFRKDSRGDLDIYSIKFKDSDAKKTVFTGHILTEKKVDYNDYQEFYAYSKEGETIKVPATFEMKDATWVKGDKTKEKLRPRFFFEGTYTLNIGGTNKSFKDFELPENYGDYPLINVTTAEAIDKNYKSFVGTRVPTIPAPVASANVELTSKQGDLVGQYTVNPKSGKLIMAIPPGTYLLNVSADGYEPISEEIKVFGKGSFVPMMSKDFTLTPTGEIETVNHKDL